MADEDDVIITCCSTLTLCAASAFLLLENKRRHSVWVKRYIRDRETYGVFYTLLPELATRDAQRWLHYIRVEITTFEELCSLVEPLIIKKKTRFRSLSV